MITENKPETAPSKNALYPEVVGIDPTPNDRGPARWALGNAHRATTDPDDGGILDT